MKKMTLLFALVIVAMVSFGHAHNRTGFIKTGQTVLDKPMVFTSDDTVLTGDSTLISITSEQLNPTKQNLYSTLAVVSGSPSVTIKLFGKCFSGDAFVQIGSTITWTEVAHNPINISAVTPNQYRYYKVEYICGGTGGVKITAFELKLWLTSGLASSGTLTDGTATINSGAVAGVTTIAASGRITGTGGATISGAATNINASSNFATNIGTGSTTQAVTIGNAANTIALVSPTTVTGLLTTSAGINLGTSQSLIGTTAVTVGDNSQTVAVNSSDWDISATGVMTGMGAATFDGLVTATAGLAFASGSTVFWAKGGAPMAVSDGTDVPASNGDRYWVELEIPHNATITGLSYLVGSVGATDSVMVHLYNAAGTQVATSKKAGAAHGDLVATAAELQSVAFTAPYAAVAGKYYAAVQFNGNTAKFRAYLIPGSKFVANTAGGTYDTAVASITPGTSFVASKGPIIATY